jgi:N-acetylglucosamine kinase-like BadF-type ATPase
VADAGLQVADIAAGGYGLAGLDWPSDEDRLRPVIAALGLSGPYEMVNDAFLPLRAGTADGVGLAAIAGSGATVAGRNRAGQTARSYGAGYPFTDWGGAGDIAREAVHVVAAAYKGLGPETTLDGVCGRRRADGKDHALAGADRRPVRSPGVRGCAPGR